MTVREIMVALAGGKKIGNKAWSIKEYIHLDDSKGPINRFGASVFIWSDDDFYIIEKPVECWILIEGKGWNSFMYSTLENAKKGVEMHGGKIVHMREIKEDVY